MTTGDDGQIGRTNASGADFRGAILTAADMRRANLRGVKLQGADMQGVRFEGAILERTELLYDDFSDYRLKAPALIEEWLRQNLEAGVVGGSEMRALLKRLEEALEANRVQPGGFWSWVPQRDPDKDYHNVVHRMDAHLDMLAIAGAEQ